MEEWEKNIQGLESLIISNDIQWTLDGCGGHHALSLIGFINPRQNPKDLCYYSTSRQVKILLSILLKTSMYFCS